MTIDADEYFAGALNNVAKRESDAQDRITHLEAQVKTLREALEAISAMSSLSSLGRGERLSQIGERARATLKETEPSK